MRPLAPLDSLRPERFETSEILKQVVASGRQLAELKGIAASIPNQAILINTLGLQEAKDSSEIENIVTTHDDHLPGEPLLQLVMKNGCRLAPSPGLAELRRHAAAQLVQLPEPPRSLEAVPAYDTRISTALQRLAQTVDRRI